jgi:hypothetical protein
MVQSLQFVKQLSDSVSPKVGSPHFCCCMGLFPFVPVVDVIWTSQQSTIL